MGKSREKRKPVEAPWMVTQVPAQLDAMAGACNELHRAGRKIEFIVPVAVGDTTAEFERPISYIAIFSLPDEGREPHL